MMNFIAGESHKQGYLVVWLAFIFFFSYKQTNKHAKAKLTQTTIPFCSSVSMPGPIHFDLSLALPHQPPVIGFSELFMSYNPSLLAIVRVGHGDLPLCFPLPLSTVALLFL